MDLNVQRIEVLWLHRDTCAHGIITSKRSVIFTVMYLYYLWKTNSYGNMKGTELPNPRHSSACDCSCVLTRINHCLINNSSMTLALELIWRAFRYQFIPNCLSSNLFQQLSTWAQYLQSAVHCGYLTSCNLH